MPEKKTSNMLIRKIPMDVWERIDTLCRRRDIKRREFLEQALSYFEGGGDRQGYEQEAEKARQSKLKVDQIMAAIKSYKGIIDLKKHIEYVRKNINMVGDNDTIMNIILELNNVEERLDTIIRENVPKHKIPEDPEELRKMGLAEYSYVDIPLDYKRKGFEPPAHHAEAGPEGFGEDLPKDFKGLKNRIDEIMKKGDSGKEKPKEKQEDNVKTTFFSSKGFDEPTE